MLPKISREYNCPLGESHKVYVDFIVDDIVLREKYREI